MTVKTLIELLKNVDPDMEVLVWNNIDEIYEEATYACVEEVDKLDCGERIYNEETDEYETIESFCITN